MHALRASYQKCLSRTVNENRFAVEEQDVLPVALPRWGNGFRGTLERLDRKNMIERRKMVK